MMRTPDGHGKLELTKYDTPGRSARGRRIRRPTRWACIASCSLSTTSITPSAACALTVPNSLGEVAQYENIFLLCYLRGPAGVIVALAEQIG